MPTFSRFALPLLLATLLPGVVQAQQPTFPPGSAVGLVPPKGMTLSKRFSGFENASTGASILTADMPPEAYAAILPSFTPEGMAKSGLQASGPATDLAIKGGEGKLLKGTQAAYGSTYRKWVVLAKSRNGTAMVSAQAPEASAAAFPDSVIEASLSTIAFRKPPGLEEQASALPFQVGDRAGFRLVRVLSGSGLVLTEGPEDTLSDASQPVVVVASSLGGGVPTEPAARLAFAKHAFSTVAGVDDLVLEGEKAFEQDGASWIRLEGRGTYRATAEAVYVLQLIRFTPSGYVRAVAISRTLDKPRFAERFDRLAQSITTQ